MRKGIFAKRHYEVIAQVIASLPAASRLEAAAAFIAVLAVDNPRFDEGRFWKAIKGANQ